MSILLTTDRAYLRQFEATDAHLLDELDRDPLVRRYVDQPNPPEPGHGEMILARWLPFYSEGPRDGYWAAHLRSEGEPFIGWFHFRPNRSDADESEIGYRLHREFWGQGFATEIGRALVQRGIQDFGVTRIVGHALTENLASRRVLEKIGLSFEKNYTYDERLPAVKYGWSASE